ncbi:GAF domain-containing protein [Agrilutibacter solisilvae]|uniref:histidine kinase n=1 Tax=Agrilutibacter solisilvae TaxID=2763317 RepID=A0A974XZJ6_9GAMM|nr:GAF domain-containing protein [Lysobacter solisilvae]QSX77840.1 GAF domain-containing protein [Lysobacter solisilvae]
MSTPVFAPAPTREAASPRTLLERQREVLEAIVRGSPLEDILAALCHIVEAEALRPVHAAILLVDADCGCLRGGAAPSLPDHYNRAVDGVPISADIGTCAAAAATGRVVVTPDIANDPAWSALAHLPLALGLVGAWSMPIFSSTGRVLGTFGTYFGQVREPTEAERQLVGVLAQTAALAIERQQADAALRASDARHRFLAELATATQPLTDPALLMSTTARLLVEHLGVDRCAYAEVEGERVFVINGDHPVGDMRSIVGRWDMAAFGTACVERMLAGEAFVVTDTDTDPRIGADDLPAYRATQIRAVICVPLHKDRRLSAAMAVHQSHPRQWTSGEIDLMRLVVARCWEALERARVARDLAVSEDRYRAMVEANPESVNVLDAEGTVLHMNAAGLRVAEAPAADVLGHCVYDLVVPEDRAAFQSLNERVCRGEEGGLAFEVIGRGGTRRSMEALGVPLLAAGGGYHQLAFTRDVTARVRADRALAESRARLDIAVRLSGVGFFYCDLPFDELVWDDRVREHFFVGPDERVDIDLFYSRLHPVDRERTRQAIEDSIAQRVAYDIVYRTCDPVSDEFKWIRALGGATYAADGSPARFDGVTLDVSVHKRQQEFLTRLLEGERTQARLLGRVAQAGRAIHACDSVESVLATTSEAAREIIGAHMAVTGLSQGPDGSPVMQGLSLSGQLAEHGGRDAPSAGRGIYRLVCETNRPLRLTHAELLAHPCYDVAQDEVGERSHLPLRGLLAAPLVGFDGRNLGAVQLSDRSEGEFTESDESILVQLAQFASVALENARLYEQLREHDRRKDEFLATLAHELRNPLAPLRNGLSILRMTRDPVMVERTQLVMERQLGHLMRLVDDLLDVSRITRDKVTLVRERVDLQAIVDSALDIARPLIEAQGHALTVELPTFPVELDGDRTRLAQVVANLLNNAAKYTPASGHVDLTVIVQDGQARISVRDDGIGIAPRMLPRVFDLFAQADHSLERSQGGLGIGLTLVQRLVALHGGRVEAHSPGHDQGSTFVVWLPLVSDAAPAPPPDAAPPVPSVRLG